MSKNKPTGEEITIRELLHADRPRVVSTGKDAKVIPKTKNAQLQTSFNKTRISPNKEATLNSQQKSKSTTTSRNTPTAMQKMAPVLPDTLEIDVQGK